jgi:putative ABC transport system permease protein
MDWTRTIREEFERAGRPVDDDVVEELAQHARAAWTAARADGASPDAADAGVRALVTAWCRGISGPRHVRRSTLVDAAPATSARLAGLRLDVRHGLRLLRRQPGFAAVSILLIALGIGATTTLFSVVNGVLLKPLPWHGADRLVRLYETREGSTVSREPIFTNATYLAWQAQPSTIEGLGAWTTGTRTTDAAGGTERVAVASVTASLFPLLRASPQIGAGFTSADEISAASVLIAHGYWQSRFGGAADIVGRSLRLDGRPYTIAGVMPRGFEFPTPDVRLWLPFQVRPAMQPGSPQRSISMFSALARLAPGATPARAAQEAEARGGAVPDLGIVLAAVFGSNGPVRVTAVPMIDAIAGDLKPALWTLLIAVSLLCAAAIGNVASMQLARATARQREMAIRSAIGAGAGRLARQLFVETSLMVVAGSLGGLGLAYALVGAAPAFLPEGFPRAENVVVDVIVLAAVALLTLVVSLAIGLLPLRLARRVNLVDALVEDGSAPVGQRWRTPLARSRIVIIAAQVAIATVLMVGAVLLARSFAGLWRADRGYVPSSALTARVAGPGRSAPAGQRAAFFDELVTRVRRLPGVTHVGFTNALPLTAGEMRMGFIMPPTSGDTRAPATVHTLLRVVSPDYFAAIGMRLLEGRAFVPQDTLDAEPVVIVNQTFARRYLGADPLRSILPTALDGAREGATSWRIVGVVQDVRHRSATDQVQPEIYLTPSQLAGGPSAAQFLVVRTAGDPLRLATDLRSVARAADSNALVEQVMTMDARLLATLARPRLYALLLGAFAVFALLIAGIGLFSGLMYGVSQRTREIGIRTALGATPGDIVRLVVSQGAMMTAAGLVVGFAVAAFSAKGLSSFLFGVPTRDPLSFVLVGAVLAAVALVACAVPARRAARIDPLKGMRSQA